MGFHDTQVPNSCRKWHNIYILVLIHSPLYMSHTILRWVVIVSSLPHMPMQIEVWAVSNLTFVLLSFAIPHTLNDRSSVQTVGWHSALVDSKLFVNTRNACTQRNETQALGLPVVKSNTRRRNVWGGVIQDVRSQKDLICNVIQWAYS